MGQGGSISENKSIILSNWVEAKPNSNIFYNKVTNQQIERHEVLINDKQDLSSYSIRMHDQSLLICRLIYFHPKSTPKDETAKKHHVKHPSNEMLQYNNRAKSMIKQPSQLNIEHRSSPKNGSSNNSQMQPKIYCVYTDRMIPVKEWNKEKIIDVIGAFRKLIQMYGFFKVREHCICENERKEIKIWINENPVSNFVVESVESEEDMIADLAALLVSKKEKIAKQLLDLQYFSQVIDHFSKLNEFDIKKYFSSGQPHPTTSNRTTGFPTASYRQSQTSQPSQPSSEINNFYNVFMNTQNNYSVNNSLQNSKYNLVNKVTFGYPCYAPNAQKSNQQSQNSKAGHHENQEKKENDKKTNVASFKTANEIKLKREYSPAEYGFPGSNLTLGQVPTFIPSLKAEQKQHVNNQKSSSQIHSLNHVSHSTIGTKESRKKVYGLQQKSGFETEIHHPDQHLGEKDLMENTSIMVNAKKDTSATVKKGSLDSEKKHHSIEKEERSHLHYMIISEKKTPSSLAPTSILYSTQAPKSHIMPKFIQSSQQDIKNRSKNNSSDDIKHKGKIKTENSFPIDSFGMVKKEVILNLNTNEVTKTTMNQKELFSNGNVQNPKSGSSFQNYLTPSNNPYVKPGSSFKQKQTQLNINSGGSNFNQQSRAEIQAKGFIKSEYNIAARSQSKVFVKSHNFQQNQLVTHFESARNVLSQMSTLKVPNGANPTIPNTLSKKSFPKYFQQKLSAKSIQKYHEKSLEQRQKSRAIIGKVDQKNLGQNFGMSFGGDAFRNQHPKMKDITQDIVLQVFDSEACSQQVIPPSYGPQVQNTINENQLKAQLQSYEPRRKFPSTTEGKPKKLMDMNQFEEKQCKRNKEGAEIDSHQSHDTVKPELLNQPQTKNQRQKQQKNCTNTDCIESENKSYIMAKSYFTNMNINNSVLIGNSQYDKLQHKTKNFETDTKKKKSFDTASKQDNQSEEKFKFKDLERKEVEEMTEGISNANSGSGPFYKIDEKKSLHYEEPKSRDSIAEFEDPATRNQSFPYQPNSAIRKNEKQFTFFNSNHKSTVVGNIEEINRFEPVQSKNKVYLKKQFINSVDEQESLPRTTADERQKRTFKETRQSQVLIEMSDLHRSDPGQKIQQIVQKIEKKKEALIKKNVKIMLDEKIDVKQYPIFKKWQPSMNVFGSLINQQQNYGSCIKKKEYAKSQQESAHDDKLSLQDSQKDENEKIYSGMAHSENLETKKKIRKEVLMDYKGLFGDENPFQKEETPEEKEKARRLEIKKKRQQEERLLENASSKDLLIQEKVQKQKEKHAQLKSDLSKLFTQQM